MIQLYFSPGACSFVPHAMLEDSGLAFEPVMVKLHKGEQNAEPFRTLNPRGQVPVTEPLIPPPPSAPAKEKPESKDFLDLPKTTVP